MTITLTPEERKLLGLLVEDWLLMKKESHQIGLAKTELVDGLIKTLCERGMFSDTSITKASRAELDDAIKQSEADIACAETIVMKLKMAVTEN